MNEEAIRNEFEKAIKNIDEAIQPIDDVDYIDYLVLNIWLKIPHELRMPSVEGMISEMVSEKIMDVRENYFKKIGLIEDEEKGPKKDDYLIEINITDPGTVFHVSGAGPGYMDIVRTLEEAAGSIVFHNRMDSLSIPKNDFNLSMEIYDGNESDPDDQNFFGREKEHINLNDIIDILLEARLFLADYNKNKSTR